MNYANYTILSCPRPCRCISRLSISIYQYLYLYLYLSRSLTFFKWQLYQNRTTHIRQMPETKLSGISCALIKEALSISQLNYSLERDDLTRLDSTRLESIRLDAVAISHGLLSANHCANARSSCWNSIAIKNLRK